MGETLKVSPQSYPLKNCLQFFFFFSKQNKKTKTGAHTILNFYKKEIKQSRNSSQGADLQLNRGGICEGPKSDPRKAKLEHIENWQHHEWELNLAPVLD